LNDSYPPFLYNRMYITAVIVQFPITFSIRQNVAIIRQALAEAAAGDLIVFPEGSVSGYADDLSFLNDINHQELQEALTLLHQEAQQRQLYLWVGACLRKQGQWFNAGLGLMPDGKRYEYHKINLATHERGVFTAGVQLPIFPLHTAQGVIRVGVQLCRELRYPEQWGWLARQQAQIMLHLNNAINDTKNLPVWRSHLISRAAETQRFVISANNAAPHQKSPTIVVAPDGSVVGEIVSDQFRFLRVELDLSQVSDFYLNQCRADVVILTKAS
jgi:predicted amidohydrolase